MIPQPGTMGGRDGRQWWRPALAMFAVGYGANQFVPLLSVYREALHLSDAQATAVFGVYALGLIPGLLLGGLASDRYGRRPLMLAFAALSLVATAVLITGRWGPGGLYAGRLLTGVVSGTVFTIGTAWVKELSTGAAPGTGARRAAVALTAGFGVGPLVAGPLAQWAPAPEVLPYIVHLVLAAAALAVLPGAPETRPSSPVPRRRPRLLPTSVSSGRFRRLILPLGPWVFGSVTLVFTTLPAHGVRSVPALGVALPGLLAAASLGAGFAVWPGTTKSAPCPPPARRPEEGEGARACSEWPADLGLLLSGCDQQWLQGVPALPGLQRQQGRAHPPGPAGTGRPRWRRPTR